MKNEITFEYVDDFLNELEKRLNPTEFDKPDYLNTMYGKIVHKLASTHKLHPGKGALNQAYMLYLTEGKVKKNVLLESMLLVRPTRSNSGELEITVMLPATGMSCKYNCTMCPNEIDPMTGKPKVSRSYLTSEGTTILGTIEEFDGFRQVIRRIALLEHKMGHTPDKILLILLGGTFHSYEEEVRESFITRCIYACNMYHHLSVKFKGDKLDKINQWFDEFPFKHHHSVMYGALGEAIKEFRPIGSLAEEKAENTFAPCARITGIVIETRPDQVSYKNLYDLRRYGVTRIQFGIQHTDKTVLTLMERAHEVRASELALQKCADNCWKIDGHLMPDCPGSTYKSDLEMFRQVFQGNKLQLDYCKIYPCMKLPFTEIGGWLDRTNEMLANGEIDEVKKRYTMMCNGNFKELQAYAESLGFKDKKDIYVWLSQAENEYDLFEQLMLESIKMIPPWVRLNRFLRDFPKASVKNEGIGYESKNLKTNLQQMCMESLEAKGLRSYDIRAREIRKRIYTNIKDKAYLYIRHYKANNGYEFFVSVEIPEHKTDYDDSVIMGHIRLRIPEWDMEKASNPNFTKLAPSWYLNTFKRKPTLRVRELHVYGNLQSHNQTGNSQHKGIGKFLMGIAEYIAIHYNMEQIAVIASMGNRDYYRKLGYTLNEESHGEYMIKREFSKDTIQLFGIQYKYDTVIPFKNNSIHYKRYTKMEDIAELYVIGKINKIYNLLIIKQNFWCWCLIFILIIYFFKLI
jgi:histone acetyltransferase (RNA polymerase elongator complex component)